MFALMQTVLPYLRTFILTSLPPALPSTLHGACPRSSSSLLRSSPGGCAAGCAALPPPLSQLFPTLSDAYPHTNAHIYLHRVHGAPPFPSPPRTLRALPHRR
ncbi:hypothetical protein JB92DRAFT_3060058 [Gautieria morchelliformis]|nr:hypothetical protein JB92DRAFT_3060058 [Gautieria morchelliformis]